MKSLLVILFALALSALLAVGVFFIPTFLGPAEQPPATNGATVPSASVTAFNPRTRRQPWEDSGYMLSLAFMQPITDPWSLEHIRDCYEGRSSRARQFFRQELAREREPQKRIELLLNLYSLHLFDGEFQEASARLDEASDLARSHAVLADFLPAISFFHGVVELRRGETENCVECQCQGSCIFPIRPEAVHMKPAGSRQAIPHFQECLRHNPEDLEARWLLNIAYMTLGEYPDKVPPEYLLSPDLFKSEFDIGRFTDVASLVGVNKFDHAGGAIMDDFDNDGRLDIIESSSNPSTPMSFFRNKGDGKFEDVSKKSGISKELNSLYIVQTDYNNDGWLDVFVTRGAWGLNDAHKTRGFPQRPTLLRNNKDGTFTDVTREAGFQPMTGQVAAWADYDNDGWLDVFIGNEGGPSCLYRNRGDGTFEEVSNKAGIHVDCMCKAANWGDYDNDGYPDLYVSSLNSPAVLYHNNGDGTFSDATALLPVVISTGFSCWFFDYDNDGWPDLFATSFQRTLSDVVRCLMGRKGFSAPSRLYRNLQGKGFEDVTEKAGLLQTFSTMGSNFADFDNDGYLDFYLSTGEPGLASLVPNRMFKNVEGQRFADITTSSGTGHLQKGHAIACGDWDRDGNVDIYAQIGGVVAIDAFRNALFQNPGQGNHWLSIKLVGEKTNRAAIGARLKVTTAGPKPLTVHRTVSTGSSFGANTLEQTIGIGKAERIATVEVYWPTSKTRQVFRDVPIDGAVEIKEFAKEYRPLKWQRIAVPK